MAKRGGPLMTEERPMKFSQRYGHKPVRRLLQKESMDEHLRVGLWNVLDLFVWSMARDDFLSNNEGLKNFCRSLWFSYFKRPLDKIEDYWPETLKELRAYFFSCKWFEVYDFIEFTVNHFAEGPRDFSDLINAVLERELAAFRLVDGVISPITNAEETQSIESAIKNSSDPVSLHVHRALELLSDRTAPDYRNSVKEGLTKSGKDGVTRVLPS
jgi:hypothetical protein